MINEELIQRSPLRILENSIDGGLGKGISGCWPRARASARPPAWSTSPPTSSSRASPSSMSPTPAGWTTSSPGTRRSSRSCPRKKGLKAAAEFHDEIVKNRVIMNFNQDGARTEQVLRSLEAMIVHGKFAADTIIVDGFDFAQGTPEDIRKFKEFAGRLGLEVWFSASLKGDDPLFDDKGIPLGLDGLPRRDRRPHLPPSRGRGSSGWSSSRPTAHANPVKLRLRLDPKTLLLARK